LASPFSPGDYTPALGILGIGGRGYGARRGLSIGMGILGIGIIGLCEPGFRGFGNLTYSPRREELVPSPLGPVVWNETLSPGDGRNRCRLTGMEGIRNRCTKGTE